MDVVQLYTQPNYFHFLLLTQCPRVLLDGLNDRPHNVVVALVSRVGQFAVFAPLATLPYRESTA
jgi:hypothetical protein